MPLLIAFVIAAFVMLNADSDASSTTQTVQMATEERIAHVIAQAKAWIAEPAGTGRTADAVAQPAQPGPVKPRPVQARRLEPVTIPAALLSADSQGERAVLLWQQR